MAGFEFPDHEWLGEPSRRTREYPITRGRLISALGLDIGPEDFEHHVVEEHVEHSTALHARLVDRMMPARPAGPRPQRHELSPVAKEAARAAGLSAGERNPFRSIVVRAVEVLYACDEALRIIDVYREPDRAAVEVVARAGVGYGWTEAPRGMLWHRYECDADGSITSARIVPPTSQNQAAIERDLFHFVEHHLDLDDGDLGRRAEQVIRSYDPCISADTLPRPDRRPHVTGRVVVISVGNPSRRDDGVGWVVAAAGRRLGETVEIRLCDGDPARLLGAWTDVELSVVVGAMRSGLARRDPP